MLTFINTQLFPQLKGLSVGKKARGRRSVVRDVFEDAYNYMKSGQLMRQIIDKINSAFRPYASIGTNLLFFQKGEPTQEIWFYEHRVPDDQKAYSMTRPIKVEHMKPCVDWWGGAERKGRQESEVAWKISLEEIKARSYNLDFKNPHTVADDHGDLDELLTRLNEAEQQAAALRDQLKAILAEALLR